MEENLKRGGPSLFVEIGKSLTVWLTYEKQPLNYAIITTTYE